MFDSLLGLISHFIIKVIEYSGYAGIVFLMALESMNLPIFSELVMPFAGFLITQGDFTLLGITIFGALGNLTGSVVSYGFGYYGGRPFFKKYGKYFLISEYELNRSEGWFKQYGTTAVFFGRFVPVLRTFVSLPAGLAKMNFIKFSVYSFFGSLPWVFALAYVGFWLGERWGVVRQYFQKFDIVIFIGLVILIGWLLYLKIKPDYENNKKNI